ncbi:hypothetical protein [uncultured Cetobacterium sp.]|uniref:hypothetical protein n=1 Tax=uncultured Cetobacterium sp. TaxID=527638 RepID=UPI0026305125|nr:hypothetical protein [uncultured Cetobacterium sp.]
MRTNFKDFLQGQMKRGILFNMSVLILFFLILNSFTFASLSGFTIETGFQKFLGMIIRTFRYIMAVGIIFTLLAFFKGGQMWMMGLGVVIVSLIISNLDKILDALQLTGGVLIG